MEGEPLYEELGSEIGALSDFAVHFTPEFFGRFEWEEKPLPGGGAEFYFGLIEGAIEMGFLMLCKHHELIVRVFDRCQDGKMLQQPDVRKAIYRVRDLPENLRQMLAPAFDAMITRRGLDTNETLTLMSDHGP